MRSPPFRPWQLTRSLDRRHASHLFEVAIAECASCDRPPGRQQDHSRRSRCAVAKLKSRVPTKEIISRPTQSPASAPLALASSYFATSRLAHNSSALTAPVCRRVQATPQRPSHGMNMARSTTRGAAAAAGRATRRSLHTGGASTTAKSHAAEPNNSSLAAVASVLESPPPPPLPSSRISRATGVDRAAAALLDPESDEEVPAEASEVKEALARLPPVNSDYLPLPWKGRLGYACLNTYLRYANPPVFSSRTCRIASILENRHPLQDPSQPFHAAKNRPDREQTPDHARGQAYVQALGLANARDIVKMLRWNEKYGIKFMRLSSEMFPFASHEVYGYKLAPFASEVLAEAGRVAAELGHRLTMHPGQFTQLGSPRKEVIQSSIRDLEFHSELLRLLKLPPQQDRDAVMILHMGGVFGDREATLDRFRENYKNLSQDIKNRIVLENDDVSWSVHDLLPICEELNIPLVLDFHHHNIVFDSDKMREGTLDIMQLYDRIRATWTRKGITQKMHYSEPEPTAITPRQRRKHNPRVYTLPPCDPTMDLMIEAKDKEQAVFELMRKYKLPGHERINEMIPHVRADENKQWKPPRKTKRSGDFIDLSQLTPPPLEIALDEVSMGGRDGRVYWPPGCEDWLRPKKRVIVRKNVEDGTSTLIMKSSTITMKAVASTKVPSKKIKAKGFPDALSKRTAKSRKRKKSDAGIVSPSSSDELPREVDKPYERTISDSADHLITPTPTPTRRSQRAKRVNYVEDNST